MLLNLRNATVLALILAVCFISATGCKKTVIETINKDSVLDKTVTFTLWQYDGFEAQGTGTVYVTLFKFNIADYVDVDSVVFSANPAMQLATGSGPLDSATVTLYDITDSVPIAGSRLASNQSYTSGTTGTSFLQTGNIFSAMPAKQITIGAVITNNTQGSQIAYNGAICTSAYLYLYRK